MKIPPSIIWLQYSFANVAIVLLVPFLALQGMPPVDWLWNWTIRAAPDEEGAVDPTEDRTPVAGWLAEKTTPLANLTGVSTASWSMFAPAPDATNHRLRAKIEYRDGTTVEWRSPEWPQLSCWQRFCTSRELEYIDKLAYGSPQDRWFAFADVLAAQNCRNPGPDGAPKRVTFVMEEAFIDDPEITGWLPMSKPIPRTREDVITPKRVYPQPPELLNKERRPGRTVAMIAAWNRFFHQPSDLRIPALIRIGCASLVFINLIAWLPYLEMWFGETGVLPRDVWRIPDDPAPAMLQPWSLLAIVPRGQVALNVCYGIFLLQTVCLLVGLASRFSAASVFIWLVSFQNRNPMILDGEDDVLRLISFFLIFMPLAEVWSVDSWLRGRGVKHDLLYQSHCSPWAVRMLQYFMVLVMFATGLWKLSGEPWRDGTALYYVARIDDLFGRFPVPNYLFDTPWTVRAMTWCVLYVELAIPILIWIPTARRFSLIVLLAFHLSNEWAMHLFLFHWIMLCGWLSFLKREDLDAVAKFWQRVTASRKRESSAAELEQPRKQVSGD